MKTVKGRVILIGGAVLVIGAVILIILLSNSEAAYRSISVSEVFGKVITQNNGKSYEAYKNMVIGGGYSLSTEKESYTRMVLDGDKYMKLEEESSASFVSLGSPQSKKTAIRLDYGALSTEITQPLTEDEDFIVNTPNAVLAVRGTFFRVVASFDTNGDAYTDVYTYGGTIDCHRIMPDGTEVDEHVIIDKGYKARIKMDEIITVYVEELIEEEKDDVDPLEIQEVQDDQLVDIYNASAHGHEMFLTVKELWLEILERNIDLSEYNSAYDGGEIPAFTDEGVNTSESQSSDSAEETTKVEETSETTTSTAEEQSGTLPFETAEPPEVVTNDNGGHSGVPPDETAELPPDGTVQPPPDETAEQLPQVTPDETEKSPPEVMTETTPPPVKPPDGTGGPTTTDEIYNPPETTDEFVDPPETADEIVDSLETTDEVVDSPETTDEVVEPPETTTSESEPIPDDPDLIAIDEVNFPDTVFRQYVSANFDMDKDEYLSTDECEAATNIDVRGSSPYNGGGVTSLKGIEYFTKLTTLYCGSNGDLTELDLSRNTALRELDCFDTAITELDVSNNTALEYLYCRGNSITELDVSNNTALKDLKCYSTQISALDVSKNTALESLSCYSTKLAFVDISGNSAINIFIANDNKHPITLTNGTFDTSTIPGFKPSRVSNVNGAVWDASTGIFSGVTEGTTEITYTYDCDGKGTNNVTFTLVPDENSTYYGSVMINAENFPDALFRQYVMYNFDTDNDNVLSKGECEAVTSIDVSGSSPNMTSLKGIENFTKLETLYCYLSSGLTDLDVSKNTALTDLRCGNTSISSLDVSKNTALTYLGCYNTSISSLDVSKNTALTDLWCYNTSISSLDVSKNTMLTSLGCYNCKIAYVDISDNNAIISFNANSNRYPITVTNSTFDTKTISGFDPSRVSDVNVSDGIVWDGATGVFSGVTKGKIITYTYDCDGNGAGGRNVMFTLVPDENSTYAFEPVEINDVNFPDAVFKQYVTDNFDTDKNNILSKAECEAVTSINVSGMTPFDDGGVKSVKGIENFTNLTDLSCSYNNGLKNLDVSNNTLLETLNCSFTSVRTLDLSNNTALVRLDCYGASITELDISKNTSLESMRCFRTQISKLDVSNNTELSTLDCSNTKLAYIDISNNSAISTFNANDNSHSVTLTDGTFDTHSIEGFEPSRVSDVNISDGIVWDEAAGTFSGVAEGKVITYTYDCDGVGGHDVTFTLVPDENSTYYKGVEINSEIFPDEKFREYVSSNFDKDSDGFLSTDECEAVTKIDVAGTGSSAADDGGITSLKGIENFTKLKRLSCYYNSGLITLDISKNTALENLQCFYTQLTALDVSNNTALIDLGCYGTKITELDVSKNTALILMQCYNTKITDLDVSKNTALKTLSCYGTKITTLDVSKNTALTFLACGSTQLTTLDVSNNAALTDLSCYDTQLTALDVSNNTALTDLWCDDTQLTALDVSKNTALTTLWCRNTQLTALDVSNNTALTDLRCYNTQLTTLDVSNNTALKHLYCYNTSISSLDVSKNTVLTDLRCNNCKLAYVDISNNSAITTLYANDNKHPITVTNGTFDTNTVPGFNPARVSNVSGAVWDEATGTFSEIAEGTTAIAYTYDCDGVHGHDVVFTLVPNDASTYASNLLVDTLSLDDVGEELTDIETNSSVDVNVPPSDEETPSDITSEENSENVSEVTEEETEQKGEKIPEPPPDVDDLVESETDETLNESTGDEVLTESTSDEILTEPAEDEILTESAEDETLTESTGDEILTESTGDEILMEPAGDETLTESAEDETLTESTEDYGGEDLTQSTLDSSAENLTETTVNDSAESGSEVITETELNFTPETVTQTLTDAA